jgi:plastocyanin
MSTTRTGLAIVALALLAAACGDDDAATTTAPPETTTSVGEPTMPPTTMAATTTTAPTDDGTVVIEMRGVAFAPAEVTVAVGTTVQWVNRDFADHTTTANGEWDAYLAQGDTFDYVADTPGEFAYVCTLHLGMAGTLIVEG